MNSIRLVNRQSKYCYTVQLGDLFGIVRQSLARSMSFDKINI